jgi:hypothetical protein
VACHMVSVECGQGSSPRTSPAQHPYDTRTGALMSLNVLSSTGRSKMKGP